MQVQYAKPFMTITELATMGLSKNYLRQLSRAKDAPITRTVGGGKIYFETARLNEFMVEVTRREEIERYKKRRHR